MTADEESPPCISHEDMQRVFAGGPELNGSTVLVRLSSGRLYKREGNVWRRLGNGDEFNRGT